MVHICDYDEMIYVINSNCLIVAYNLNFEPCYLRGLLKANYSLFDSHHHLYLLRVESGSNHRRLSHT